MSKQLLLVLATGLIASQAMAVEPSLRRDVATAANTGNHNSVCVEMLFKGDLGPEIGIGCANPSGTSGGPNDVAVGVTASLTPPFVLTSHFYNRFTATSPTITALSFVCWAGGDSPGAEIPGSRRLGLPFSGGDHTVELLPPVIISSQQFYFGQNQPQTNAGIDWGVDTSSGSAGTSYVRAPACGVDTFFLLDALGFPGNWVFRVCADGSVPVELTSWGSVKAAFR